MTLDQIELPKGKPAGGREAIADAVYLRFAPYAGPGQTVRQLLTLGLAVGAVTAPVAALLLVLAFRDRREDRLLGLIAPEIARLRGAVGLEVRCATFRPVARVTLHTWLCAPEERWSVWLRCAQAVPPGVQVVTEAPLGPGLVGRLVARRSPRWP